MDNKIISWMNNNSNDKSVLDISSCSRIGTPNVDGKLSKMFYSAFSNKLIGGYLPNGFGFGKYDFSNITVLGGICLLTTADMKSIFEKKEGYCFSSIRQFENWYTSWYPRIDQLHDSVGILNYVKEIVYVVEDIFFAKRIASYTGLDTMDIAEVLRKVHESQGHPVFCAYLKNYGYKGTVRHVFISDIESELDVVFKTWSRFLRIKIKENEMDFSKVEIMYTNLWLDVLGISGIGLIYEPTTKLRIRPWLENSDTLLKNNIGKGFNKDLGVLAYAPFITSKGGMSNLRFDEVPNFGNFSSFDFSGDLSWYSINILFMKGRLRDCGLDSFSDNELKDNIREELNRIFNIQQSSLIK